MRSHRPGRPGPHGAGPAGVCACVCVRLCLRVCVCADLRGCGCGWVWTGAWRRGCVGEWVRMWEWVCVLGGRPFLIGLVLCEFECEVLKSVPLVFASLFTVLLRQETPQS